MGRPHFTERAWVYYQTGARIKAARKGKKETSETDLKKSLKCELRNFGFTLKKAKTSAIDIGRWKKVVKALCSLRPKVNKKIKV